MAMASIVRVMRCHGTGKITKCNGFHMASNAARRGLSSGISHATHALGPHSPYNFELYYGHGLQGLTALLACHAGPEVNFFLALPYARAA